ncbi:unnamed protein product [Haemonchus placei]|uniref:DUF4808 domain-containing protein n=1 Tax=Haemonchus placei TaxID=6290 RepID=A0A0N4WSY5_HAEPC|nr:unnamed protein product [Haemonchus placei]
MISAVDPTSKIALTGVMPSVNGALSKLLCPCYSLKESQGGEIARNEETDRYEPRETEHLIRVDETTQEQRPDNVLTKEVAGSQTIVEQQPAAVTVEVTTPISEELTEEQDFCGVLSDPFQFLAIVVVLLVWTFVVVFRGAFVKTPSASPVAPMTIFTQAP